MNTYWVEFEYSYDYIDEKDEIIAWDKLVNEEKH